ncbi:light-harvesting antenna LH1, beta subunit [Erythrobacter sp. LQ02-29]|uniref:light-harvesting antenna LH1, beta subunit n=1 Tax=Erythrobacter sp. LQ02-29 TaxID=2920384 RepID=UPI001F4E8E2B|nr:light-harvesting antenna LH1, beta subunit [Erythrobacter sp. LQ02-29]MCP9221138.1 light-harvesting antenna LH1, beta subunit [Erythrobacter sp. LQ02-29]
MADLNDPHHHERTSLSGLTEAEAREFHSYFTKSFLAFLAVAIVAHILTWMAAPWGI